MAWTRARIDEELTRLVVTIFGIEPSEIQPETTFAGDLVAESLDYIDLEMEISGIFGIDFDFSEQAEPLRKAAGGPVRFCDLADHIEQNVS